MFQRILICTEFTDGLHRLVDFVGDLAIAGCQQIVFLHVVPLVDSGIIPKVNEEGVDRAKKRLGRALEQVPEGVEVKVEVESGKAIDTILKVSKAYQTQLIVLGTESRALLTEKLFGSTLVALSRQSKTPLLVLRPQLITTYRNEELRLRCQHLFQYLLLPYNGTPSAKHMLDQVKSYIQASPRPVVERCLLYWVVRESGRRELLTEPLVQQAQETLQAVKAEMEMERLQVDAQVAQGNPLSTILSVAETEDISAIALTSDASSQRLEWFISSFAGELLRSSLHPVLFFPPV